ncbi:MAG: SlyX family protein [Pirellulaceae bacterium]|nr:SlyX family protein [Pirellulaceae bacterium]
MAKADLQKRITVLEERLSYQQRLLDQLNEEIYQMGKALAWANQRLELFNRKVESLEGSLENPRSAEEERPPHY